MVGGDLIPRGDMRRTSRQWVQPVGFLKQGQRLLDVEGLLDESFRVPFTARQGKEVAAVHMNRPGQTLDRIQHRVDDVMPERDPAASILPSTFPVTRRQKMLSSRPV